jgi:hypothetical protein
MDGYDEEMFDDLAIDEAEGSADQGDEMDELDELDSGDEMDEADEADEVDAYDEYDEADETDAWDETDEGDHWDETDEGDESPASPTRTLDRAMAHALAAEDTDEFFRRIARGVRRVAQVARRVAPVVGRIARAAAPIAGMIPGPWGAAARAATSVLGRLRADEASEEEVLDAFAELAVRNPAALPIAAAVATRRMLGPAAARLPAAQREQAVRTVRQAATRLVNNGGPTAIRALPRLARSVQRTAVARRTPPAQRPQVLARTAARIAGRGAGLQRQLTRPLPTGREVLRRAGAGAIAGAARGIASAYGGGGYGGRGRRRRIVIRGPIRRIVISR